MAISPDAVSTGFMKQFMISAEKAAHEYECGIYVENVMNEFLPKWFERRGYILEPNELCPSYYLTPDQILVLRNFIGLNYIGCGWLVEGTKEL